MKPAQRRLVLTAFKLLDLLVGLMAFALAFRIAYFGAHAASFDAFLSVRVTIQNVVVFLVFLFLWHLVLHVTGMYRPKRLKDPARDFGGAVKTSTLMVLLLAAIAGDLSLKAITPLFLAVFWVVSMSGVLGIRLLFRTSIQYRLAKARHARHVLIVGTNARARQLADNMRRDRGSEYRVIGFVDNPWADSKLPMNDDYRLVATLDSLPAFLRDHVVDEVIICIPVKSFYDQAASVIRHCEEQGIPVRFPPDLFPLKVGHSQIEELEDGAVISFYTGPMDGWQLGVKRVLDVVLSLALLVFLAPLLAGVGLLIKLTSPGPVLFIQDRVGYCKRRFPLYKFRTMVEDAEQMVAQLETAETMDGPAFKMAADPRITPLGHLLRKTSIDELPQLLNVLKGDMSLVGPRPTPVREYEGFNEDWHRRRFSVRPGITGLWQISGRSSAPFPVRMKLDMQYIDKWTLWLDLQILAKTLPVVLKGEGAV